MSNSAIPILSESNVHFMERLLRDHKIDSIVEYGSGGSTKYFLNSLSERPINFVSVENSKIWFYRNIESIREKESVRGESFRRKFWRLNQYDGFYDDAHQPFTPILDGESRVARWKRAMDLGPFFRFEVDSGSRLAGKFPSLKGLFVSINKLLRIFFAKYRNERSTWHCRVGEIEFSYELVCPGIKDQFGESPNRDEYLSAGTDYIEKCQGAVLVMIDGGPRHFIVHRILEDLSHKEVHICLFDAHRPEYIQVLDNYDGVFHRGNSSLVDGSDFYESVYPDSETRDEILSKELWYYHHIPNQSGSGV